MNNESRPPEGSLPSVRLAATVMLVRPATAGYELFMLRRSGRSAFAPDAFVFPGGVVDTEDYAIASDERLASLDHQALRAMYRASVPDLLPTDVAPVSVQDAGALVIAAIRELFEEAGVLIARDGEGAYAAPSHEDRERLRQGSTSFAHLLVEHAWRVDANALHLFSHWITPPTEPRRYDTHFFLARMPQAQVARADATETHDGIWIAPHEALARYRAGNLYLVYPTIKHLERILPYGEIDALLSFGAQKPIQTIMPTMSPAEGFIMPSVLEEAW